MGNEDDLPGVTDWEQIKRCRGDRTVHCIVSERYLRFGVAHHSAFEDGHPLTVDVMLDRHGEGADRKLCELVLPVEELEAMVRRAWSDIASAEVNDPRETLRGIASAQADQMLTDLAHIMAEHELSVEALYALLGIDVASLSTHNLEHPANWLADVLMEAEDGQGTSRN